MNKTYVKIKHCAKLWVFKNKKTKYF